MSIYSFTYRVLETALHFINTAIVTVKTKEIRKELAEAEFIPFVQPIFTHEQKLTGCEVLLRIKKEGNFYSPHRYIEVIEQSEMINNIMISLLHTVGCEFSQYKDHLPEGFYFSFNITASQLRNETVIAEIINLCLSFQEKAGIILEIVERDHLVLDDDMLHILDSLMSDGVMFAIDDFGTGTSSLKYLEHVGFSFIKLDKTLTVVSKDELIYKNVIKAIVALSNSLNIKLIAEGVENNTQLHLLEREGIDAMQGFFLDKPMNIDDFKCKFIIFSDI